MMRRILFGLFLLCSFSAFATPQGPDYLVVGRDTVALLAYPLKGLPDKVAVACKLLNDWSTGCYRGYVACWQLSGKQLYLTNIASCSNAKQPTDLLFQLFGDQCKNGRVLANWVNGPLICGTGRVLKYTDEGYGSYYESEWEYTFKNGVLTDSVRYDNSRMYVSPYETDTKALSQFLHRQINWDTLPALPGDSVVRIVVSLRSDEKGIQLKLLKGAGPVWDNETLRVVGLLPGWSVYYRKGKIMPTAFFIPIVYSEANRKRYATKR